jgi:nitrite reductase/ring-hydroxylating ferredoxin subunit
MKRIFFICCLLLLSHLSCTDEQDNRIPLYPVYLNLDLTYKDKELKTIPSYKEYTDKNINHTQKEKRGFGGVLVVHTMFGEYVAFDRACPHEAQANIVVEVDEGDITFATCPQCGSKYEIGLLGTGSPHEGVSEYGLRRYNTIISGDKLYIRNY